MTNIPSQPWDRVSIDHGGPYPDGHYNLVMIDKKTRYPVVESVPSTNFHTNRERLKHIFATYGTPRRIESNNGPPFKSKEFKEFAKQEGFQHHREGDTPSSKSEWRSREMHANPKQHQTNCKSARQKPSWRHNAIQDMFIAYRSTPHPATGVAPLKP